MGSNLVILESDHARFTGALDKLRRESNAKFVFLLDKAGQHIAFAGDMTGVDPTALASLCAGNVAATEGVAQLVGENQFTSLFHEGESDSLHVSGVGSKIILLVVFDLRSSLGLVRLRVRERTPELVTIVEEVLNREERTRGGAAAGAFSDLTEEDIDALFG